MPITSSRFWSITGKRECAVAMICGMNLSTGSWMSMKSTWARGTMMSRTCISETVRAPSMIESASASSRLREYAERSRCTSCSRSPGSRISSDDRRSSRLGREGSFIAAASFYRVRVTEARARQQPDLEARHALGFPFLFMLVAAKMQQAVQHQVRVMRGERLSLRARLAGDHGMAQHHIAAVPVVREGQHVGRVGLVSVPLIQPAAFGGADDAQGRLYRYERRPPAKRPCAWKAAPRHCILNRNPILPACSSRRHR